MDAVFFFEKPKNQIHCLYGNTATPQYAIQGV